MPRLRDTGISDDMDNSGKVKPWDELTSLHRLFSDGWKLDEDDIDEIATGISIRYLADITKYGRPPGGGFIQDMLGWSPESLTIPQQRGILNVLGGQIRANQKRFWKSRDWRRDRNMMAVDNCIVCGSPLRKPESVYRGCNDTCWKRVCQKYIYA